jgi:hypothetical protein
MQTAMTAALYPVAHQPSSRFASKGAFHRAANTLCSGAPRAETGRCPPPIRHVASSLQQAERTRRVVTSPSPPEKTTAWKKGDETTRERASHCAPQRDASSCTPLIRPLIRNSALSLGSSAASAHDEDRNELREPSLTASWSFSLTSSVARPALWRKGRPSLKNGIMKERRNASFANAPVWAITWSFSPSLKQENLWFRRWRGSFFRRVNSPSPRAYQVASLAAQLRCTLRGQNGRQTDLRPCSWLYQATRAHPAIQN